MSKMREGDSYILCFLRNDIAGWFKVLPQLREGDLIMFYKKSTAAMAAILCLILLAVLFVCAPKPYSKNVWLESFMLIASGIGFGIACVRLCYERDSPLPVAITGVRITFRWLVFVVIMSVPILFVDYRVKFKYYALIHFIGFGVCAIFTIATRMSIKAIENQDDNHCVNVENRKRFYLQLSCLLDEMKRLGFGNDELANKLSSLCKDFRYGFGYSDKVRNEDERIVRLLGEMRNALDAHDDMRVSELADVLQVEFNNRERISKV